MGDPDALELESRRRIYERVSSTPGAYLRELQRALDDMPMGMLEYHLSRLQDAGLVSVQLDEHKRYFPVGMGAQEKRYLALLRQEGCRRVALHLLQHEGATRQSMRDALGLASTTLDHYLQKLVAAQLALRDEGARPHRYALARPDVVMAILVRHRPSFLDRVLDRVLDGIDAVQVRTPSPDDG